MNIELRVDGEVVIQMDVNAGLLAQLLSVKAEATTIRSTAITTMQAEQLLSRLNEKNVAFLKRIAENDGWITWGEIKQQFGLKNWAAFTAGPGKEITQVLRDTLNNKSAVLVWRNDDDWKSLEEGENEVCKVHVDGVALIALREAIKSE